MGDFSIQVEALSGDAGSVVVRIAGPANINNISAMLKQLLSAFEQADNVVVDLGGVTEIDVVGLQLFCSSHRSSLVINKGFSVTGQDQPAVRAAASASGQLRTSGCAIDTQHTCIWTGRER